MKRLLLILLISLNCQEKIRYDIHFEVVLKPTKMLFQGERGLYYDIDGRVGYKVLMIKQEKKYYLVENGIRTSLLDKNVMERLINERKR